MVFSSSTFLFAFLPAFLALYFLIPDRRAKNVVLLLASLIFYAWGEPVYVFLMIASIVANWALGLALDASPQEQVHKRRVLLAIAVVFNISVIGFFKYEGFVATNLNALLGEGVVPDLELPLPIGISFTRCKLSRTSSTCTAARLKRSETCFS